MNGAATYPPAPWRLVGRSIQVLRHVAADVAQRHVPAGAKVMRLLPGRTVCALYCAHYRPSSTLEYHELAVAPAIIQLGGRIGFWISHIYVDNAAALSGGREIWALPKELAAFRWDEGHIEVNQGARILCSARWKPSQFAVPLPLWLPLVSRAPGSVYRFSCTGHTLTAMSPALVKVDAESPYSSLGFQQAQRLLTSDLWVRISPPSSRAR